MTLVSLDIVRILAAAGATTVSAARAAEVLEQGGSLAQARREIILVEPKAAA